MDVKEKIKERVNDISKDYHDRFIIRTFDLKD